MGRTAALRMVRSRAPGFLSSSMAVGIEAGPWLEQRFGGPLGQRSGRCWVLKGLGQWPFTATVVAFR